jgi:hypothetical protein
MGPRFDPCNCNWEGAETTDVRTDLEQDSTGSESKKKTSRALFSLYLEMYHP